MHFGTRTKQLWLIAVVTALLLSTACSTQSGSDSKEPAAENPTAATTETGGEGTAEPADAKAELEPVKLKWYFLSYGTPTDMDTIEAEFNKYTQKLINATVDLVPVEAGDYEDKMNTVIASGEEFDIAWTSNWSFGYVGNVNKGAFYPIEDLLPEYAPNVTRLFGDKLEDARINGSIYAIPIYQTMTQIQGFVVQKRFADKYNLDVSSIKTYTDLEPFLQQIKENEPDIIPFGAAKDHSPIWSAYDISWTGVTFRNSDPTKIIHTDFEPEYEKHLQTMHKWFKNGWINQDAATAPDLKSVLAKGNVAVSQDFNLKAGGEAGHKAENGGHDVIYIPTQVPTFTGVTATMNAISHTSKNPERAVMLLDLMASNADMFNLLKYGIEGKHYNLNAEGKVVPIKDSGYPMGVQGWVMGNETIGYLMEGQPDDTWEVTIERNEKAQRSPLYGFTFNGENVKTEIAAMQSVSGEFGAGLQTGTLDPAEYLPQLRDALKKAGVDAYLAEQQRQLDEWFASKK
ncbi:ABC transporter substrate-binding protein [Paenibacillus sp.]|uniref:ABC transporter substrate-binding protein n=1 Tax=Paenibacillus sp. TaxID=58172 RepID=UPI002D50552F|nr:ABC transporter substrate-binding protein [Paenibacillus sp.]HZG56685.1 ABC transporter substrate-binding protein [Paenibacillus sp.]